MEVDFKIIFRFFYFFFKIIVSFVGDGMQPERGVVDFRPVRSTAREQATEGELGEGLAYVY